MSSYRYEKKQRALAAKAALAGNVGIIRTFPVEMLASGILEKQCVRKLEMLMNSSGLWTLLRPSELKNSNKVLAFRMITGAMATLVRDIVDVNERFPTKAYRLLRQPELGPAFEAEAWCLKDPVTRELQRTTTLGDLKSRRRLAARAILVKDNNVPCEVFNAQMRKLVKVRTQCPQMKLKDLSTAAIAHQFRERSDSLSEAKAEAQRGANRAGGADAGPVKRRGQGGAWHAWLHRTGEPDFHDAAIRMHALSAEDKEALKQEGSEATKRARSGGKAFESRREQNARRDQRLVSAVLDKFIDEEESVAIASLIEESVLSGRTVKDTQMLARSPCTLR